MRLLERHVSGFPRLALCVGFSTFFWIGWWSLAVGLLGQQFSRFILNRWNQQLTDEEKNPTESSDTEFFQSLSSCEAEALFNKYGSWGVIFKLEKSGMLKKKRWGKERYIFDDGSSIVLTHTKCYWLGKSVSLIQYLVNEKIRIAFEWARKFASISWIRAHWEWVLIDAFSVILVGWMIYALLFFLLSPIA